ncbi:MAG: hypothetical protein DRI61_10560 [Chloroflexi bacterium]|nr:MAG: hypothetical protein DRI61_10560 [Chloroflexota bacterium]
MVWKGGFYVRHPEWGHWVLRMRIQSHEPSNRLFLNGHFVGYLPVKDYTYAWVSATFPISVHFLRRGYNELVIRAGHVAPDFQDPDFTWDEVLFRGIVLEREGRLSLRSKLKR